MSPPVVRRLEAIGPRELDGLCDVLIDCVDSGASVSFLLPMTRAKAADFWRAVGDSLARGERALVIAEDERGQILGTAQAVWASPENQPHRADIAKMLVRRSARRHGVGALVLAAAERAALDAGRTLLVLDTASADAERLYQRGGWQRVGAVPKYALLPDGAFCGTVFYYKDLAAR
ncbi:MAG TPA: GNAT family N-acetyltransferase [Steroidobacteraceae bacterium]|nr:GNAT family N-acetyltransferase [Steroidobacteraceae bacterium]